jgi:hypothetical protein
MLNSVIMMELEERDAFPQGFLCSQILMADG